MTATFDSISTTLAYGGQPSCRSRVRQVLEQLDGIDVPSSALRDIIEATSCVGAHSLFYADLERHLIETDAVGLARLTRSAQDWLDRAASPSPDWESSIHPGGPPLRAWQAEALRSWCEHGRWGVIEAVTGTGKSRVGIEAVREALSEDCSVVIAVPTRDLVDQWVRALREHDVPGVAVVEQGLAPKFAQHRVLVGTVQALYYRPPSRVDGKVLLVADECHRYGAGQWSMLLDFSYQRRLGLTATFERNDDGLERLLNYFGGPPVYRIGFDKAIADGVVAPYSVQLVGVTLDPRERREYDEAHEAVVDNRNQLLSADFPSEPFGLFMQRVSEAADDRDGPEDPTVVDVARRYLKAFTQRITILSSARAKLDAITELAPEVSRSTGTLVFTRSIAASEEIASTLRQAGIECEPVHSDLTRTVRRDRLAGLKSQRIKALVAPAVLDEGVDVPEVDLGIVLGGSKSRRQMIQRMGRVLRLKHDRRSATFVVVYARNTVEDLTQEDGQEGCLDLILASASSVVRRELGGADELSETTVLGAATPHVDDADDPAATISQPVAGPADDVSDEPAVPLTVEARARAPLGWSGRPWPRAINRSLDIAIAQLGPLTDLHLSEAALSRYHAIHGSVERDVAVGLRRLMEDLQTDRDRCEVRADHVVLGRAGYEVAIEVTSRTVTSYQSHGQKRSYCEYIQRGRATRSPSRLLLSWAREGDPLEVDDPGDLLDYIDFATICYGDQTFKRAYSLVDRASYNDWDVDRAIRSVMVEDVADAEHVVRLQGGFAVPGFSGQRAWVFRPDGLWVALRGAKALEPVGPEQADTYRELAMPVEPDLEEAVMAATDAVIPSVEDAVDGDVKNRTELGDEVAAEQEYVRSAPHGIDIVDQIERLIEFNRAGYLTDEEFAIAKAKILR